MRKWFFKLKLWKKIDNTNWESIKNCAQKWYPKLCACLFEVTWTFGKMWFKEYQQGWYCYWNLTSHFSNIQYRRKLILLWLKCTNWFHAYPTPQIDSMSMAPSMGRGLNYETGSTNTNGSDSSQSHLITTPSIVGSSNGYQQASSVHRQPSQPINGSVIDGGMGSRARSK